MAVASCWTGVGACRVAIVLWCPASSIGKSVANGMVSVGVVKLFSSKGPCPLPSPRWRGKYEQSDREILGGSDWLPSRGKSKSANEHTRKFRSMVVFT
jgi:hypothetical protein